MNKTITTLLETNVRGQLAGADIGGGICIAVKPGIGKTQTMYKIAKDLNMNVLQISIPEVSTENLSGLPEFNKAPHMDKYAITGDTGSQSTVWTAPQIIENANRLANEVGKAGCILFIDDLHRVNMAVAPYLYGLLGERKLGSFKLDTKVAIMGAMNDSDEAGFSGIDSPIKDRIGILPVPFDFDYWMDNFGKKLHFYIASFLRSHPTYSQEDESTMIEQFGTPRSWTHLANEFELYDREFLKAHSALIAKQKVSASAANELAKHIAYVEAIDFSEKIAKKQPIDIKALKPLDQVLYAYIINYVETLDDAEYVMSLIDSNIHVSNFIGFIIGELYTKFLTKAAGKPLSDGVKVLLEKLLKTPYSRKDYSKPLTPEQLKKYGKLNFKEHDVLFKISSEFIH